MFCKRLNATITTDFCVKRQRDAKEKGSSVVESLLQCENCPQGQELLAKEKKGKTKSNRDVVLLKKSVSKEREQRATEKREKQEKNKEKICKEELEDLFNNMGVLFEANRTFFHPIGIEMSLNDKHEVEFYKEKNTKYSMVYDKIDKMRQGIFRSYAQQRKIDRRKKLGFEIQVEDLFHSENITKINRIIPFKEKKLNTLEKYLGQFFYSMRTGLWENHLEKDTNYNFPTKKSLLEKIKKKTEEKDWKNVACFSMMLYFYENIYYEIKLHMVAEEIENKRGKYMEEENVI